MNIANANEIIDRDKDYNYHRIPRMQFDLIPVRKNCHRTVFRSRARVGFQVEAKSLWFNAGYDGIEPEGCDLPPGSCAAFRRHIRTKRCGNLRPRVVKFTLKVPESKKTRGD
jgi:hypothetical protein